MRPPHSNEDKIVRGIGAAVILIVLYYCWVYIVGFLALVGLYYVIQEYQRGKNDRNRWH